jgi:hypothetical protein
LPESTVNNCTLHHDRDVCLVVFSALFTKLFGCGGNVKAEFSFETCNFEVGCCARVQEWYFPEGEEEVSLLRSWFQNKV